jgi:hypothetical protein
VNAASYVNLYESFAISTNIIRRRLAAIDKNKSAVSDVSGKILKLGGEAMISYFARLLVILNNATIPSDWEKALMIAIYRGRDRSLVSNHRPVSSTSVVSKQMEHVIASYLREIWDKKDCIFEGQHGFRPGFSCESKVIKVCQDIADSLDNEGRTDAIMMDFSKAFDLVPHD